MIVLSTEPGSFLLRVIVLTGALKLDCQMEYFSTVIDLCRERFI